MHPLRSWRVQLVWCWCLYPMRGRLAHLRVPGPDQALHPDGDGRVLWCRAVFHRGHLHRVRVLPDRQRDAQRLRNERGGVRGVRGWDVRCVGNCMRTLSREHQLNGWGGWLHCRCGVL